MEREGEAGGPEGTEAEGREVTGDAAGARAQRGGHPARDGPSPGSVVTATDATHSVAPRPGPSRTSRLTRHTTLSFL